MHVPQSIANFLVEMQKIPVNRIAVDFPELGESITVEYQSDDQRYTFQADINRKNKISSKKISYLLRNNKEVCLRRLCLNNGSHQNPPAPAPVGFLQPYEDLLIEENHLHVYMENFGDKWAIPLREFHELGVTSDDSLADIMRKFFMHCNIVESFVRPNLFAQCKPL